MLKNNTPRKTGKTAESWSYDVTHNDGIHTLVFRNSNINNGINVALIIDRGHVSSDGTWVSGHHYISSVMSELVKEIKNKREEK